jgi:phospholipase C
MTSIRAIPTSQPASITRAISCAFERSDLWQDSLIIVTYDENGGFVGSCCPAHSRPLAGGLGARVPRLVIGPLAKKGFVDHTQHDTTSILKLIETRFDPKPLGEREAAVADMTAALDLSQAAK